ncbi:MAG: hypothetical protein LC793_16275 [Thermomicrobia bacterium]|nr:hypothetical protein [Thermomicrobia bacterium]MCA1723027.1 hypothetical protein [Thermomicrobia bacterium]
MAMMKIESGALTIELKRMAKECKQMAEDERGNEKCHYFMGRVDAYEQIIHIINRTERT